MSVPRIALGVKIVRRWHRTWVRPSGHTYEQQVAELENGSFAFRSRSDRAVRRSTLRWSMWEHTQRESMDDPEWHEVEG